MINFHEFCELHNISELNITYDVFFTFVQRGMTPFQLQMGKGRVHPCIDSASHGRAQCQHLGGCTLAVGVSLPQNWGLN